MPGKHAGTGKRGGVPAGLESLDGHLALSLATLEAFPVRQDHRADGRGDQQCAGQLERPQVLGEDQRRQTLDVAAGVGLRQTGVTLGGDAADTGDEHDPECQPGHHGGNPLPAQRFHQRLGRVHADQHQDEQEQHHHRAGVDHDLYDAEEQGVFDHVEHREDEHRHRQ